MSTPLSRIPENTDVHLGACPGCADCGLEDLRDMNDDVERYEAASEPYFSWTWCDACDSHLGGDRHPAHMRDEDGALVHLNVCSDCFNVLAETT